MGIKNKEPLTAMPKGVQMSGAAAVKAQKERQAKIDRDRREAKKKRSERTRLSSGLVSRGKGVMSSGGAAELAKAIEDKDNGVYAQVGYHVTNGVGRHVVHVTHDGYDRRPYTLSA